MGAFKKIICVDFDGVIHWYRKGWQSGVIYDEPVPGSMSWLLTLIADPGIEVAIYSSRSKDPELLDLMQDWLYDHLLEASNINDGSEFHDSIFQKIKFPTSKPLAWLTIDDRGMTFKGEFPHIKQIKEFKTWLQ